MPRGVYDRSAFKRHNVVQTTGKPGRPKGSKNKASVAQKVQTNEAQFGMYKVLANVTEDQLNRLLTLGIGFHVQKID